MSKNTGKGMNRGMVKGAGGGTNRGTGKGAGGGTGKNTWTGAGGAANKNAGAGGAANKSAGAGRAANKNAGASRGTHKSSGTSRGAHLSADAGGAANRSASAGRAAHKFAANKRRPDFTAKSTHRKEQAPTELIADKQEELLPFLLRSFEAKGRNSVKSFLARGQVSVGGQAVTRHDLLLNPGQKVIVSWGKVIEESRFVGLRIMHEDDDVIVIEKDAGLLSIATDQEKELTAYRQLTDHVRRHDPRSRIFVVHRLDRDTSGVMMFAKTESAKQLLQNDWQEAVTERTYVALVEGTVRNPEGTVRSWLKENKAMLMYSSQTPNDGQLAVTHYKTLRSSKDYSLLEVRLETGRKNQIRVHMQDLGHPVVGDKKYGSRAKGIGRLGLHAHVLAFRHPIRNTELRFESKVPSDFTRVFREAEPK